MTNIEEKEYIPEGNETRMSSALKRCSDILSILCNPFLVPMFAFTLLFAFTYLIIMPIQYMFSVLSIVFTFTFFAPIIFIYIYKWSNNLTFKEINERKKRFIPYILTIMSYAACVLLMNRLHFPHYFSNILIAMLLTMIACYLLNLRWRISTHLAGCGMFVGGLISYSLLFHFNPIWPLCGFILLSGIQGTARISYHKHTLLEVIVGFLVGMFCSIIGILFI